MKRIAWLTLTAALLASCEKATGPASHGAPAFSLLATGTTFSGEATVVRVAAAGLTPIELGKAGPLRPEGGAEESSLISVSRDQTAGVLAAEVVHAAVVGQGNSSSAEAFVANPSLTVLGTEIRANALRSQAEARCGGAGGASASGSSEIVGLTVAGQPIDVSGSPNQTVSIGGVTIIINEQTGSANGNSADITVNALHVMAVDPFTGATLLDVVISSAHADITCAGAAACAPPAGDFVTGGGWITGTPSGARGNFGVAGGIKHGAFWGHLTYIDHGGSKVKGTGVTGYEVTGALSRRITGTAEVDGAGVTYTVDVIDNGEPGREDTFTIELSNEYRASGTLAGGNIQLHAKPNQCL
jgi:hypothetical protein